MASPITWHPVTGVAAVSGIVSADDRSLIAARSPVDGSLRSGSIESGQRDGWLLWPIKKEASMRVEESIIIDRPPEEVFGFLSVRAN